MSQSEAAQRWEERLQRFESSPCTVAQFCSDEGVPQSSYYHWRRRLRGPAKPKGPSARFLPVALNPIADPQPDPPQWATTTRSARTTIDLPGGVRVTVEVPTEPATLGNNAEDRS